jgi:UDP-N-acetylglucosamine acyltransferase
MISSLAHIHPDAKLGSNVTIDPFCFIEGDVVIGDGTHIMPNVCVYSGSRIGKNCKIFPGAVIGAIPQDLKFKGEYTTAEIGDNTTIRECVTINRGTVDKNTSKVGNNCLLMAYAHVAHDCIVGDNVILANGVQLAGHVTVEDHAIVGGLTGIHQFIHIGAHSYVAGQVLVRKDVPPFVKAARDPVSYVGINTVGLTRRNYSKETLDEISKVYHILFVQGHSTSKAIELIETTTTNSPARDQILSFVKNSKLGIIKRHKDTTAEDFAF